MDRSVDGVWVCPNCGCVNDDSEHICTKEGCNTGSPYNAAAARGPVGAGDEEVEQKIQRLCETCGHDDGTTPPLNIVFLGRPGAGKSSLINSFAAPLGDGWYPYAPSAPSTKGKPKSIHVRSFPKSCMAMDTGRTNVRLQFYRNKYQDILLPTLIDVAGLNDEDELPMKRFVKLLLYGHIWKGAKAIKVYEDCQTLGEEELFRKYARCYEDMRIDVVVFVASVDDPLPEKLIECVAEIAEAQHTEEGSRAVNLFGVLTKKDTQQMVNAAKVEEKQTKFKKALGVNDENFLYCSCFCSQLFPKDGPITSERQAEIAEPLLEFLDRMCDPRNEVMQPNEPMPDPEPKRPANGKGNDKKDDGDTAPENQEEGWQRQHRHPHRHRRTQWPSWSTFLYDLMASLFFSLLLLATLISLSWALGWQMGDLSGDLKEDLSAICDSPGASVNSSDSPPLQPHEAYQEGCQGPGGVSLFWSQLRSLLWLVLIVFLELLAFLQVVHFLER